MTVPQLLLAYDPNDIKPGWVALGIVVALAVATFLLWRNMNSQLRRIDVPTRAELAEQERRGTAEADLDTPDADRPADSDSTEPAADDSETGRP